MRPCAVTPDRCWQIEPVAGTFRAKRALARLRSARASDSMIMRITLNCSGEERYHAHSSQTDTSALSNVGVAVRLAR